MSLFVVIEQKPFPTRSLLRQAMGMVRLRCSHEPRTSLCSNSSNKLPVDSFLFVVIEQKTIPDTVASAVGDGYGFGFDVPLSFSSKLGSFSQAMMTTGILSSP
jgi:hypothetical protein